MQRSRTLQAANYHSFDAEWYLLLLARARRSDSQYPFNRQRSTTHQSSHKVFPVEVELEIATVPSSTLTSSSVQHNFLHADGLIWLHKQRQLLRRRASKLVNDRWQSLPAEKQNELENSPEFQVIEEELKSLSLESTDNSTASDRRKGLHAQKRKLVSEELRKFQKLQPRKLSSKADRSDLAGHYGGTRRKYHDAGSRYAHL